MKLLISNLKEFNDAANSFELAKEIHKNTWQTLGQSLAKGNIPLTIVAEYSNNEECIVFEFDKKVDENYFYTFTTKTF